MVYWWVTDLYFSNEPIQFGSIEIMTATYCSSVSFGSRVRSTSISHKTYTFRRSNFRSNPTPIHVSVQKSDFNYS